MTVFVPHRETRQVRGYTEPLGNDIDLDMLLIPSGSFLMGSSEDEEGHQPRESPVHLVQVPAFFMGQYPVTQAQWRIVAQMLPRVKIDLKDAPSRFKGERNPVEQVTWYEAVEFCDRLSIDTGRSYRLPSEAEWEYACRAGTTTPFHLGETISTEVANYRGQDWEVGGQTYPGKYGEGDYGDFRQKTTPVDFLNSTNAFGLADMHGNVWEWCQDIWHETYDDAPEDGSAWIENGNDSDRILRGGSCVNLPRYCRSAARLRNDPGVGHIKFGFRVVCAVPRTPLTSAL